MDTYLEQLQRSEIRFLVVSSMKEPGPYHEKVDRLGLREHVLTVDLDSGTQLLRAVFRTRGGRPGLWQWLRNAKLLRSLEPSLKGRLRLLLQGLHAARALTAWEDIHVIHSHALGLGFAFLPAAAHFRIPLILTFHGLMPSGVPQVAVHRRRALFERAARVLVNTRFARRHAIDLGCPADRIVVLPQGLPLEDFPFAPRPAPAAGEPLRLLSVGRFHRDKGQGYALLALRRLVDQGIDARWDYVGVGPDRERLARVANALGLGERVLFHEGLSPEGLRRLYATNHLFVLASVNNEHRHEHVETQGVVLQEAQASGCIPIATRVGGIPECINDGKDGVLIRDRSHRAIADAVLDLLSKPGQWRSLQVNGRRNVEERFSAEVIGRRMAALIREVAGGKGEGPREESNHALDAGAAGHSG